MEKIIPINTSVKRFYKQYLNVVKPLLSPYLVNGEINILSELMYLNYKYRNLSEKDRGVLMMDYDNKMDIISDLGISYSTFNNNMTSLKKKGYVIGNKLKPSLSIIPNKEYSVTYKFNIDEDLEDKQD